MSNSGSLLFFFFTFILCCSSTAANNERNNDLINRICRNTTDFAFCQDVIYADPHAPQADQSFIAYIAFRAAYFNATDTGRYIALKLSSMVGRKSSGGMLRALRKCRGYYHGAVNSLSQMLGNLDSDTFSDLDKMSLEVDRDARACKAAVGDRSVVVKQRNENLIKLANICLVISKLYPYA